MDKISHDGSVFFIARPQVLPGVTHGHSWHRRPWRTPANLRERPGLERTAPRESACVCVCVGVGVCTHATWQVVALCVW